MMETNPANAESREHWLDEVLGAYLDALDRGEAPDQGALLALYPELAPELSEYFANQDQICALADQMRPTLLLERPGESTGAPTLSVVSAEDSSFDSESRDRRDVGLVSEDFLHGGDSDDDDPARRPPPQGEGGYHRFGDFELIAKIGEGGMGMVFRARQRSLNRLVAIKMVRGGRHARKADLQRFRNEAEAAAKLDHPNIVPIYEVGKLGGLRFFSMRLVEGGDLAANLGRFTANRRSAVQLLAAVARGVHHAHQRGILHRDLKPSNIVLEADGKPLVTDFGLAKRSEGTPDDETLPGERLGTPAYMAPEQATGIKGGITISTDVYGLGALLYALLTGHAPFRGETLEAILEKVKTRVPDRPLADDRSTNRDLNTICLKCLEKDPASRYASALEVAEELERWLAGKPIAARPISAAARLWRWCRANSLVAGLSATIASLLFSGIVVVAVATFLVWHGRWETQAALTRATELSVKVRAVVDDMYTRVAEEWLPTQPQSESLQRDLLLKALNAYEAFLRESGNDPSVQLEAGNAYRRVGEIQLLLGSYGHAERACRSAIQVLSRLAGEHPRQPNTRNELARAYQVLGRVRFATKHFREAEVANRRALDLQERLVADYPGTAAFRHGLAQTLQNLGELQTLSGDLAAAEAAYGRAIKFYGEQPAGTGKGPDPRSEMGGTANDMALLFIARGNLAGARGLLERAIASQQAALNTDDRHPKYRKFLGNHELNLGDTLSLLGMLGPAEQAYRKAIGYRTRLVEDFPAVSAYRTQLLNAEAKLAQLFDATGRVEEAREGYRRALRWREGLPRGSAEIPEFLQASAMIYLRLGHLEQSIGRVYEAESLLQQAIELERTLSSNWPEERDHRVQHAEALMTRGRMQASGGRPADAEASYGEAVTVLEGLNHESPDRLHSLSPLTGSHLNVGSLLQAVGRTTEAERTLRRTLANQQALLVSFPSRPGYRHDMARTLFDLGELLQNRGRAGEAEPVYRQAREAQDGLARDFPDVPHYRSDLAQTLAALGTLTGSSLSPGEKESQLRRATTILEDLVKNFPVVVEYRQLLVFTQQRLANLQFVARNIEAAEESYQRAVHVCETLVEGAMNRVEDLSAYGVALNELAILLAMGKKQPREALPLLEKAIINQAAALEPNPRNPIFRRFLLNHYKNLALTLQALKENAALAQAAEDLGGALPDSAEAAVFAGKVFWVCLLASEDASVANDDPAATGPRLLIDRAMEQFQRAAKVLEQEPDAVPDRTKLHYELADGQENLARYLITCPREGLRNPSRALELAKQAVTRSPNTGKFWATLGAAHYRHGDWEDAVDALKKASTLRSSDLGEEGFIMAMAHWRLGRKDEALACFDRAAARAAVNGPEPDILRLQSEAAHLLGRTEPAQDAGPGSTETPRQPPT